jgi:hypothetical protein
MATDRTKTKRWKNRDTHTTGGRPGEGKGRTVYRRENTGKSSPVANLGFWLGALILMVSTAGHAPTPGTDAA